MTSELWAQKRRVSGGIPPAWTAPPIERLIGKYGLPRKSPQALPLALALWWGSLDSMMRYLKFERSEPMHEADNSRLSRTCLRQVGPAAPGEGEGHITSTPKLPFYSTVLPSRNGRILLKTNDRGTRYSSHYRAGHWMLFRASGSGSYFEISRTASLKPAPFAIKEIHAETH